MWRTHPSSIRSSRRNFTIIPWLREKKKNNPCFFSWRKRNSADAVGPKTRRSKQASWGEAVWIYWWMCLQQGGGSVTCSPRKTSEKMPSDPVPFKTDPSYTQITEWEVAPSQEMTVLKLNSGALLGLARWWCINRQVWGSIHSQVSLAVRHLTCCKRDTKSTVSCCAETRRYVSLLPVINGLDVCLRY